MSHAGAIGSGGLCKNEELYFRQYLKAPPFYFSDYYISKRDLHDSVLNTLILINSLDNNIDSKGVSLLKKKNEENLQKLDYLNSSIKKGNEPEWLLKSDINKLRNEIIDNVIGFNLSIILDAKKITETEKTELKYKIIKDISKEIYDNYGLIIANNKHFLSNVFFKNSEKTNFTNLLLEKQNIVGFDNILISLPYKFENKDGELKPVKIDKVRFKNENFQGNEVAPDVALFSMFIAKGFFTLEQLEKHGTIHIANMANKISEEVEMLKSNGIKPITKPAEDRNFDNIVNSRSGYNFEKS